MDGLALRALRFAQTPAHRLPTVSLDSSEDYVLVPAHSHLDNRFAVAHTAHRPGDDEAYIHSDSPATRSSAAAWNRHGWPLLPVPRTAGNYPDAWGSWSPEFNGS